MGFSSDIGAPRAQATSGLTARTFAKRRILSLEHSGHRSGHIGRARLTHCEISPGEMTAPPPHAQSIAATASCWCELNDLAALLTHFFEREDQTGAKSFLNRPRGAPGTRLFACRPALNSPGLSKQPRAARRRWRCHKPRYARRISGIAASGPGAPSAKPLPSATTYA